MFWCVHELEPRFGECRDHLSHPRPAAFRDRTFLPNEKEPKGILSAWFRLFIVPVVNKIDLMHMNPAHCRQIIEFGTGGIKIENMLHHGIAMDYVELML